MPLQMRRSEPNRRANIWTARFIPLLLVAIISYSTWVVTDLVCVRYLIRPDPALRLPRRTGAAIAVLITFYLLLIILLLCYARLVQTVIGNPGLVPRGPQYYIERERKAKEERYRNEKGSSDNDSSEGYGKLPKGHRQADTEAQKVQDFWLKDVFVVKYDGRPAFCSQCYNYKPTRAHHCSELNRCVYKMDHFCPWVGGIVSETSFKFFINFVFWTACFTTEVLVIMAYFIAERRRREGNFLNVHWILVLAFAALFFIFGSGMCSSSLQFAMQNTTTIENLSRRSHIWYLAVHVPEHVLQKYHASGRTDLRLITYPRPREEQLQVLQQNGAEVKMNSGDVTPPNGAIPAATVRSQSVGANEPPPGSIPLSTMTRTFVILQTKPGSNPFDIGYFGNFKDVMGANLLDWLFPLRQSPCTKHDDPECMYKVGKVVEELKRDAGIVDGVERRHSSHRRKRRKRQDGL